MTQDHTLGNKLIQTAKNWIDHYQKTITEESEYSQFIAKSETVRTVFYVFFDADFLTPVYSDFMNLKDERLQDEILLMCFEEIYQQSHFYYEHKYKPACFSSVFEYNVLTLMKNNPTVDKIQEFFYIFCEQRIRTHLVNVFYCFSTVLCSETDESSNRTTLFQMEQKIKESILTLELLENLSDENTQLLETLINFRDNLLPIIQRTIFVNIEGVKEQLKDFILKLAKNMEYIKIINNNNMDICSFYQICKELSGKKNLEYYPAITFLFQFSMFCTEYRIILDMALLHGMDSFNTLCTFNPEKSKTVLLNLFTRTRKMFEKTANTISDFIDSQHQHKSTITEIRTFLHKIENIIKNVIGVFYFPTEHNFKTYFSFLDAFYLKTKEYTLELKKFREQIENTTVLSNKLNSDDLFNEDTLFNSEHHSKRNSWFSYFDDSFQRHVFYRDLHVIISLMGWFLYLYFHRYSLTEGNVIIGVNNLRTLCLNIFKEAANFPYSKNEMLINIDKLLDIVESEMNHPGYKLTKFFFLCENEQYLLNTSRKEFEEIHLFSSEVTKTIFSEIQQGITFKILDKSSFANDARILYLKRNIQKVYPQEISYWLCFDALAHIFKCILPSINLLVKVLQNTSNLIQHFKNDEDELEASNFFMQYNIINPKRNNCFEEMTNTTFEKDIQKCLILMNCINSTSFNEVISSQYKKFIEFTKTISITQTNDTEIIENFHGLITLYSFSNIELLNQSISQNISVIQHIYSSSLPPILSNVIKESIMIYFKRTDDTIKFTTALPTPNFYLNFSRTDFIERIDHFQFSKELSFLVDVLSLCYKYLTMNVKKIKNFEIVIKELLREVSRLYEAPINRSGFLYPTSKNYQFMKTIFEEYYNFTSSSKNEKYDQQLFKETCFQCISPLVITVFFMTKCICSSIIDFSRISAENCLQFAIQLKNICSFDHICQLLSLLFKLVFQKEVSKKYIQSIHESVVESVNATQINDIFTTNLIDVGKKIFAELNNIVITQYQQIDSDDIEIEMLSTFDKYVNDIENNPQNYSIIHAYLISMFEKTEVQSQSEQFKNMFKYLKELFNSFSTECDNIEKYVFVFSSLYFMRHPFVTVSKWIVQNYDDLNNESIFIEDYEKVITYFHNILTILKYRLFKSKLNILSHKKYKQICELDKFEHSFELFIQQNSVCIARMHFLPDFIRIVLDCLVSNSNTVLLAWYYSFHNEGRFTGITTSNQRDTFFLVLWKCFAELYEQNLDEFTKFSEITIEDIYKLTPHLSINQNSNWVNITSCLTDFEKINKSDTFLTSYYLCELFSLVITTPYSQISALLFIAIRFLMFKPFLSPIFKELLDMVIHVFSTNSHQHVLTSYHIIHCEGDYSDLISHLSHSNPIPNYLYSLFDSKNTKSLLKVTTPIRDVVYNALLQIKKYYGMLLIWQQCMKQKGFCENYTDPIPGLQYNLYTLRNAIKLFTLVDTSHSKTNYFRSIEICDEFLLQILFTTMECVNLDLDKLFFSVLDHDFTGLFILQGQLKKN
ncbi:hypothetical protein QTN25_001350 [Entamoeba marina]